MHVRSDLKDISAKEILGRIQLREELARWRIPVGSTPDTTGTMEVIAEVSGSDRVSMIAKEVVTRAAYLFSKTEGHEFSISKDEDAYRVSFWTDSGDTRLEDVPLKQAAEEVMSLQEVDGVKEVVSLITSTIYKAGRIYVTGSNNLACRLYYLASTVDPTILKHKYDNGYDILRGSEDLRLSELPVEKAKKDLASLRTCRGDEIVEVHTECRKNRAVTRPFM